MEVQEKIFADGFSFKRREEAPEFVIGRQSIKVDDAIAFLQTHAKNGWVNININKAKSGSYYCELDTWEAPKQQLAGKPVTKKATAPVSAIHEEEEDDLPF